MRNKIDDDPDLGQRKGLVGLTKLAVSGMIPAHDNLGETWPENLKMVRDPQ
jgi:hypothetical protein